MTQSVLWSYTAVKLKGALPQGLAKKEKDMGYTIKQVSEMTGLSVPTLRFYDKEGLLPELQRKESGYRIFSEEDLYSIELIECFKQSGMQIREIRHFMALVKQGDASLEERLAICQRHVKRLEEKMEDLRRALDHSLQTLEFYEIAAETGSEALAGEKYRALHPDAEEE